jgi:hypothetical protein
MAMLKKIFKALMILFVVLIVLVLGFTFVDIYMKKSNAEEICQAIQSQKDAEAVLAYAAAHDLPVFDERETHNRIVVLSQKSPLGRFSCSARFQDGVIVEVEMASAD